MENRQGIKIPLPLDLAAIYSTATFRHCRLSCYRLLIGEVPVARGPRLSLEVAVGRTGWYRLSFFASHLVELIADFITSSFLNTVHSLAKEDG